MSRKSHRSPPPPQPAAAARQAGVQAQFKEALALHQQGKLSEAEPLYNDILRQQPNHFEALQLLGALALQTDRMSRAIELIQRALAINPKLAMAHGNLGYALFSLKRYGEALASFDRAIALQPDFANAHANRGNTLLGLKRYDEALAGFDKTIALKPDFAEAYSNRGNALLAMKRHEEAIASYDKAIALKPDYAQAHSNRGYALFDTRRYAEAAAAQARTLQLQPDFDYAAGSKLHAQIFSCDWSELEPSVRLLVEDVRRGKRATLPFTLLALSASPPDQLLCSRTYCSDKHPAASNPLWTGERYRHERLRIAYLSADFHEHATAYLMAGLFEAHDKTSFDIHAYSFGPTVNSGVRDRLKSSFHEFTDVRSSSDDQVARMLRAKEIDIAIDLKGHTTDQRTGIFAHRAAPLQVNYLGFPGTIGADYIDYILGDAVVTPTGDEAFYSEKIVRLPDCYQVNDNRRAIAERTPGRDELGLPESGFVFCSFNNCFKIMPDVFDIWMRLLKRVDGSVLWLLGDNPEAVANLRREAEKRDVAPERLVFAPRMALPEHLARHRRADLFLDTLPCNAHTTASDALWTGLPVLTCMGEGFASRVAASLLKAIGLPELITTNLADYEALALRLAATPGLLAGIRTKLQANRLTHPLFDTDRFRQHLELAYQAMHERFQRGLPPDGFSVPPIS